MERKNHKGEEKYGRGGVVGWGVAEAEGGSPRELDNNGSSPTLANSI